MDTDAGRSITLPEVREKVRADWIEGQRNEARDQFHARMRKRYDIRIEWPEAWNGLPETANPEPKTKRLPEVGE